MKNIEDIIYDLECLQTIIKKNTIPTKIRENAKFSPRKFRFLKKRIYALARQYVYLTEEISSIIWDLKTYRIIQKEKENEVSKM